VNLYEFNTDVAPFNDEKVREAFSLALERDRLVQKETAGAMSPATSLVPFIDSFVMTEENADKAKRLLAEAGFPDGRDFPSVTLVVNRNDLQLRIARAAVRAWKSALGVEVQIEIKELKDIEPTRDAGTFNIIRRGIVFPTASEKIARELIFDSQRADETPRASKPDIGENISEEKTENREVPFKSIALYFPRSYSLVKPSVDGFSINLFGATPVKKVSVTVRK
jgi:oligopeptide transport system substrate-binding protein